VIRLTVPQFLAIPVVNPNTINGGFPAAYPGNEPDPVFDAYSIQQSPTKRHDTSGTIHSFIMVQS
jgi:hypothetical protein